MKFKPIKRAPLWIACGVIALVCLVRWFQFDFFDRIERMTYDMRVREALKSRPTVATNLGFVFIDEDSIRYVKTNRAIGFHFGLYWPRQVYGRLIHELAAQGAKAVGLDVIFGDLREDHPSVQMADGSLMDSDRFFAVQMERASNVILAVTREVMPPLDFLTNALAIGDISTDKDSDGILRRAQAFSVYRKWHFAFRQVEADPDLGIDLNKARIEPAQIVLPRREGDIKVPLDPDGNFDLADFGGEKLPPGVARKAKPFTEERVWHMGVVLAARELKLDLEHAEVDLPHGRITLRGPGGLQRTIPVVAAGFFYLDWCMPPAHPLLARAAIQDLLTQNGKRLNGETNNLSREWNGKLVVVGSGAVVGNDLLDRGATPLEKNTLLVSKHWNVANSIITGRFVQRASLGVDLAIIIVFGIIVAVLTRYLRVWVGTGFVVLLAVAYVAAAVLIYAKARYWLPLALPLIGAILMQYVMLMAWRAFFEQKERRRVRSTFSKIVSPKIVNELLKSETLPSLGGARREITVLFADVRGFTELTDSSQERVAEIVRRRNLSGAEAEACFDQQARETLDTINLYLGLVADVLIKQDGTLDKFIGDCVMAFWGAPTPHPKHASACVRAAIEAQRAIDALNQQRELENKQRELENKARTSSGLPEKLLLPILVLGSGINTGMATVGLMGSKLEQQNYTVFGREVNLASRLEGASGRGRIFIGEASYQHLLRHDPDLAATCLALPGQKLKGISTEVKAYEVPWHASEAPKPGQGLPTQPPTESSALPGLVERRT